MITRFYKGPLKGELKHGRLQQLLAQRRATCRAGEGGQADGLDDDTLAGGAHAGQRVDDVVHLVARVHVVGVDTERE